MFFCDSRSDPSYVKEREIVFGRKPEVQLVRTMLEGEDACLFAVKIPPGFLEGA